MECWSRWLELGRHRGRGHGAPPERQSATKEPKIAELGACLLPPAAGWVGGCVGQACRVQPFAAVFIFLARPVRRIFGAIPPLDGEIWGPTCRDGRIRGSHLPLFSASLQPSAFSACFSPFFSFSPDNSRLLLFRERCTPGVLLQHAATRAEQQGGGHGGRLPDPSASARARRYLSGTTWPQTMPILPWTRMPCAPAACMC